MKKTLLFISLLLVSNFAFAGGTLPFVASVQELATSFEGIMTGITVIAIIAFVTYAALGEGGGLGKLIFTAVFLSIGLAAGTVAASWLGGAGAGALLF